MFVLAKLSEAMSQDVVEEIVRILTRLDMDICLSGGGGKKVKEKRSYCFWIK